MPGKSEKMTGVGGIFASGAKGVCVAGAGVNAGETGALDAHPLKRSISKRIANSFLTTNPYFSPSGTSKVNSHKSVFSTGISNL